MMPVTQMKMPPTQRRPFTDEMAPVKLPTLPSVRSASRTGIVALQNTAEVPPCLIPSYAVTSNLLPSDSALPAPLNPKERQSQSKNASSCNVHHEPSRTDSLRILKRSSLQKPTVRREFAGKEAAQSIALSSGSSSMRSSMGLFGSPAFAGRIVVSSSALLAFTETPSAAKFKFSFSAVSSCLSRANNVSPLRMPKFSNVVISSVGSSTRAHSSKTKGP
mmetsp:Transcript_13966/g.23844  ORF Transcript_13966/g.23844 Transcript_13966/m.23844 type:complete len:219 (+) Transcript_13966:1962-2618(+)